MTSTAAKHNRFHRDGGRSWSQEIETTAASMTTRIEVIRGRPLLPGQPESERVAVLSGVQRLIEAALDAARGEDPRYRSMRSWWRGTSIEAAFRKAHQAEADLARLYADHEVAAEVAAAVARADLALNRDDLMRAQAGLLLQMPNGPERRALLSKVIQVGHEAGDSSHARLRNFRNIVLTTTWCIAVLVLAFSLVVVLEPSAVPFCFEPAPAAAGEAAVACPSGEGPDRSPEALDVVVVAVLGLLGGALAAAVSIRNLRGTATPYDVPIALALLKVPAGALTAVGALIAIRGDFVPGLSALDSQEQVLAYALVFGYAQQLLTGLIDRQADGLLSSIPSKDAQQGRPQLSVASPPAAAVPATPTVAPTPVGA